MANRLIWSDRWMYSLEPGIIQSRQNLEHQVANNAEISPQTRDTLKTIATTLEGLRRFAAGQTRIFQDLFKQSPEILIPDPIRYPKEWVLRRTYNQVAFDLEVLQRAASQRLGAAIGPAGAKILQLADQYAYHFVLRPAIDYGYLQETTVITYFQKNPFVRVIPYAPVALIGIPYAALNVTRRHVGGPHSPPHLGDEPNLHSLAVLDFAATAHELGHYVYRHGVVPGDDKKESIQKICNNVGTKWEAKNIETQNKHRERLAYLQKSIESQFADLSSYSDLAEEQSISNAELKDLIGKDIEAILPELVAKLGAWTEEIFADIYGCLIAGPVIAFAFIELIIDNNPKWIASKDNSHPPTIIRPLIYVKVLELMGCAADAEVLLDLWQSWLQERGINKPGKEVLEKVGDFINSLIVALGMTEKKAPSNWPGQKLCGSLATVESDDFEKIFRTLNSTVVELLHDDLNRASGLDYDGVPFMQFSDDCIHGQRCQWSLEYNGRFLRSGAFWHVNIDRDTTTVIPGTFIGPETAPGILELEAHAKQPKLTIESNRWKHIFLMNGWASGGPEEDGVGS